MTTNRKEYARAYYEAHKEQYRQYSRNYWARQKQKKELNNSNPRLFDMREDYKTPTRETFKEVSQPTRSKSMEYYYSNREKILEQQKAYQKRKREKMKEEKEALARIEAEKKEERLAKQREYYKKRKAREKQRAYYAANRERILEQQRNSRAKRQREKKLSKTFFGRMRLGIEKLFKKG